MRVGSLTKLLRKDKPKKHATNWLIHLKDFFQLFSLNFSWNGEKNLSEIKKKYCGFNKVQRKAPNQTPLIRSLSKWA